MKGRITNWSKTMLKREILHRMNALDTSSEEYSNNDLLNDYENLTKHNSQTIQSANDKPCKHCGSPKIAHQDSCVNYEAD